MSKVLVGVIIFAMCVIDPTSNAIHENNSEVGTVLEVLTERLDEAPTREQLALSWSLGNVLPETDFRIQEVAGAIQALSVIQSQEHVPKGMDRAMAALRRGETSDAEAILQTVIETGQQNNRLSSQEAAVVWRHIGALAILHDDNKARRYFRRSVELDPDNEAGWMQLGLVNFRLAEYALAQRCYERVLALGESREDRQLTALAYHNLGMIHYVFFHLDKAEEFHLKSLEIENDLNRQPGIARQYFQLGAVSWMNDEFELAEEFLIKAVEVEENLERKEHLARVYNTLGDLYSSRGDVDRAMEVYVKALNIVEALNHLQGMVEIYGKLSWIYEQSNDQSQAAQYSQKAGDVFEILVKKYPDEVGDSSDP